MTCELPKSAEIATTIPHSWHSGQLIHEQCTKNMQQSYSPCCESAGACMCVVHNVLVVCTKSHVYSVLLKHDGTIVVQLETLKAQVNPVTRNVGRQVSILNHLENI